ncbi:MAG: L,D-transpeptidase family protein [Solirubrobacterales bacterium]|nr:L,D-transpeptidase family protein [Solirubrobacterales bacterium]
MKRAVHPIAVLAMLAFLAVAPAAAAAEAVPPSTAPTPAPAPVPVPTPAAAAGGHIKLVLQKVGGKPLFAIVGQRVVVRGIVTPYVSGQTVKVSFYREGRKVHVKRVSVLAMGNGVGQFHIGFTSADAGLLQARAAHYATAEQVAFSARAQSVQFVNTNLGLGAKGKSVRLLQSELNALHYAVPLTGVLDEGTGRALVAYRKMTGLERSAYTGRRVFELLERGAGGFRVHYPHDGRHIEGDLTRQVLVEIEPGGRVRSIYTMSSGKPSTPTVIGRFQVYNKEPGTNSHGMVESSYFIRGYAIHGYAEVPTYAASHGCLRVPIPDAAAIYNWVSYGMPVDVYNENGGGSTHVRGNAGP